MRESVVCVLQAASARGLSVAGNQAVTVLSGGNVGIGTTAPLENLEVSDAADSYIRIHGDIDNNTADADTALQFWDGGSAKYVIGYDDTNDDFKIAGTSFGGQPFVTVTSTGNVGIGTVGPLAKLSIQDDGYAGPLLSFHSAEANRYNMGLDMIYGDGTNVMYSFSVTENNTGYPNVLNLRRGNVGIGTTAPGAALDVNGLTKFGDSSYHGSFYKLTTVTTNVATITVGQYGAAVVTVEAGGWVSDRGPFGVRKTFKLLRNNAVLSVTEGTGENDETWFAGSASGMNNSVWVATSGTNFILQVDGFQAGAGNENGYWYGSIDVRGFLTNITLD